MRSLYVMLMVVALAITALAVPEQMNYQGKLTNPDGVAIEGTVNIRFSFWDDETAGSEVWFENRSVDVHKGLFDVHLGEINPITLRFDRDIWLQIAVEGEVLDTRQKMTTVPHAFRSAVADSLAGGVIVEHNELTGIQGGIADEYYHLTETQHSQLHAPGSDNQNLFSSVTDGVDSYTAASETDALHFQGTGGADVTVDGVTGVITIDASASGDQWGAQVVESDASLDGDGTSGAELGIAADGVNETHIDWGHGAEQVGAEDVPFDPSGLVNITSTDVDGALGDLDAAVAASGDNWGTQVAQTTLRLDGDGTAGDPLDIAQQGATDGQVLKWNAVSASWEPASDSDTDNQTDVEVPLTSLGDFTVISGIWTTRL